MHIAIEGIDGVGKSTVANLLSKKLNYQLVEKPLHLLFDEEGECDTYINIRDKVNKIKDKRLTAWFYGFGNMYLYEKYKNQNIVTDRHILSNYCWSGANETDYIFDSIYKTIGAPTFTFLLSASEKTLRKRIRTRDPNDPDIKKVEYLQTAYKNMKKIVEKYEMPHLLIDTSELTPDLVLELILETLRKEGHINVPC